MSIEAHEPPSGATLVVGRSSAADIPAEVWSLIFQYAMSLKEPKIDSGYFSICKNVTAACHSCYIHAFVDIRIGGTKLLEVNRAIDISNLSDAMQRRTLLALGHAPDGLKECVDELLFRFSKRCWLSQGVAEMLSEIICGFPNLSKLKSFFGDRLGCGSQPQLYAKIKEYQRAALPGSVPRKSLSDAPPMRPSVIDLSQSTSITTIGTHFLHHSILHRVALPSTLTRIGSSFLAESSITDSVVFPTTLTELGGLAFFRTTVVGQLVGLSETKLTEISEDFGKGAKVESLIELPNTARVVREGFLVDATVKAVKIGESTTLAENGFFKNTTIVERVQLPQTLKQIGADAFSHSSVPVLDLRLIALERIGLGFCAGARMSAVYLPPTVEYIGDSAFSHGIFGRVDLSACIHLETNIGSTFCKGARIEQLLCPLNLASFSADALSSATVTQLKLGDRLRNTGVGFLSNARVLQPFTFPKTLHILGDCALGRLTYRFRIEFETLTQLEAIGRQFLARADAIDMTHPVVLPPSVQRLGEEAFLEGNYPQTIDFRQTALTRIEDKFGYGAKFQLGVLFPDTIVSIGNKVLVISEVTVVDLRNTQVTEIGDCFCLGSNVEEIHFPSSLTKLGNQSFSETRSLLTLDLGNTALVSVEDAFCRGSHVNEVCLPQSLASLGVYAFRDSKVKKLNLSRTSLAAVGSGFCENATALESVELPTTLIKIGGTFLAGTTNVEVVDLSSTPVTSIGEGFLYLSKVKVLIPPPSLVSLGARAFSKTTQLEVVDLANCKNLNSLGEEFGELSALQKLILPPTISCLPDSSFRCGTATKIDLSATSLTAIGDGFGASSAIEVLILPPTLKVLGHSAFSNRKSGSKLDLTATSLTSIGHYFCRRSVVESVLLPVTLEHLGSCAFESTRITALDLAQTALTTVGSYFCRDTLLSNIQLPATLRALGEHSFLETYLRRVDLTDTALPDDWPNFVAGSRVLHFRDRDRASKAFQVLF